MKTSFCLEDDNEEAPSKTSADFLDAIEDYKNGKKTQKRLYKCVEKGTIRIEEYEHLIKKYGLLHRTNKEKKDRKRSQKIKHILCSAVSVIFIFASALYIVGDLVVQYGKGIALLYFFLCLFSISYITKN